MKGEKVTPCTFNGELLEDVKRQLDGPMEEKQVRQAIWHAGRWVRRFVEKNWGADHEVVWFANPPVSRYGGGGRMRKKHCR
jgi:hypothetical protein